MRAAAADFAPKHVRIPGRIVRVPFRWAAWVRGRDRVRTWGWAKLLLNAARILKNNDKRHD